MKWHQGNSWINHCTNHLNATWGDKCKDDEPEFYLFIFFTATDIPQTCRAPFYLLVFCLYTDSSTVTNYITLNELCRCTGFYCSLSLA